MANTKPKAKPKAKLPKQDCSTRKTSSAKGACKLSNSSRGYKLKRKPKKLNEKNMA